MWKDVARVRDSDPAAGGALQEDPAVQKAARSMTFLDRKFSRWRNRRSAVASRPLGLFWRLGADSADRFSLTLALEDEFGIEITDRDAVGLKTVGEISAYIERQLPATT